MEFQQDEIATLSKYYDYREKSGKDEAFIRFVNSIISELMPQKPASSWGTPSSWFRKSVSPAPSSKKKARVGLVFFFEKFPL